MSTTLNVQICDESATLPTRATKYSAGLDLASSEDIIIQPKSRGLVNTGLRLAIPNGYYGRIAPRSGLAVKHGIDVGAGVIDSDYRGLLKIVLFNHSEEEFRITKGLRIAQLICEKIDLPLVSQVSSLEDSERGESGFGSSGI